ncbi:hypothetical protein [Phaeodactylibacter luteus]|uniref:Uncharacterized protein n=1 Tax=Phaeodactylibacter luteus TaxID=1564516 RepID=A0A5C6RHP1_9BACT|nr:hypothetical protein [Phaeodactylibacter luteus]TXB61861.1 hypothetical protein FRY97_16935 [Phaeodactylibacter luteus]
MQLLRLTLLLSFFAIVQQAAAQDRWEHTEGETYTVDSPRSEAAVANGYHYTMDYLSYNWPRDRNTPVQLTKRDGDAQQIAVRSYKRSDIGHDFKAKTLIVLKERLYFVYFIYKDEEEQHELYAVELDQETLEFAAEPVQLLKAKASWIGHTYLAHIKVAPGQEFFTVRSASGMYSQELARGGVVRYFDAQLQLLQAVEVDVPEGMSRGLKQREEALFDNGAHVLVYTKDGSEATVAFRVSMKGSPEGKWCSISHEPGAFYPKTVSVAPAGEGLVVGGVYSEENTKYETAKGFFTAAIALPTGEVSAFYKTPFKPGTLRKAMPEDIRDEIEEDENLLEIDGLRAQYVQSWGEHGTIVAAEHWRNITIGKERLFLKRRINKGRKDAYEGKAYQYSDSGQRFSKERDWYIGLVSPSGELKWTVHVDAINTFSHYLNQTGITWASPEHFHLLHWGDTVDEFEFTSLFHVMITPDGAFSNSIIYQDVDWGYFLPYFDDTVRQVSAEGQAAVFYIASVASALSKRRKLVILRWNAE